MTLFLQVPHNDMRDYARNVFLEMITPIRAHRTGISKAFLCRTVDRHTATVDQESPGMQLKWKKRDSLIYHSAVQTSEVQWQQTVELSSLPYSQNQTPQDYTTGFLFPYTSAKWDAEEIQSTNQHQLQGMYWDKYYKASDTGVLNKAGLQNHLVTKVPMC